MEKCEAKAIRRWLYPTGKLSVQAEQSHAFTATWLARYGLVRAFFYGMKYCFHESTLTLPATLTLASYVNSDKQRWKVIPSSNAEFLLLLLQNKSVFHGQFEPIHCWTLVERIPFHVCTLQYSKCTINHTREDTLRSHPRVLGLSFPHIICNACLKDFLDAYSLQKQAKNRWPVFWSQQKLLESELSCISK